jgi:hypothetical protein
MKDCAKALPVKGNQSLGVNSPPLRSGHHHGTSSHHGGMQRWD